MRGGVAVAAGGGGRLLCATPPGSGGGAGALGVAEDAEVDVDVVRGHGHGVPVRIRRAPQNRWHRERRLSCCSGGVNGGKGKRKLLAPIELPRKRHVNATSDKDRVKLAT
uniref:Uncharacterized protein n=1 Tax=Oryza sativa subsp. japonica TaxID=39947 RepID=Q10HN9_ORYSJ|nr:hypothetical protein LOC_Os03g38510 [Oryza sativa Japonica Group]